MDRGKCWQSRQVNRGRHRRSRRADKGGRFGLLSDQADSIGSSTGSLKTSSVGANLGHRHCQTDGVVADLSHVRRRLGTNRADRTNHEYGGVGESFLRSKYVEAQRVSHSFDLRHKERWRLERRRWSQRSVGRADHRGWRRRLQLEILKSGLWYHIDKIFYWYFLIFHISRIHRLNIHNGGIQEENKGRESGKIKSNNILVIIPIITFTFIMF